MNSTPTERKLPTLKWKTVPGRRERLARWFIERETDLQLRKENPDSMELLRRITTTPDLNPEPPIDPFDGEIALGQIRMMDPLLFAFKNPCRPTHMPLNVVIIKEWGKDNFLVTPFSLYKEPATKTELLIDREETPLRVLCLWNTRTLERKIIERSWLIDQLTEQQQIDAWEVFKHAITGSELPDRLLIKVGCPIVHPRDPRIKYQEEEMKLFSWDTK